MTPYQTHATLGHLMSRHSPDGFDIIEECDECGQRWLHNPTYDMPITLCTRAELNRRQNAFTRTIINNDIGRGFND